MPPPSERQPAEPSPGLPAWRILDGRVLVGEYFSVSFNRTLRVPDDGRAYPLPPGLGRLPIFSAASFASRVPSAWTQRQAVFIPLHQREALWLGFDGAWWRPNAVVIACGGINVVTGQPWTGSLGKPQDYLVVPDQPWLDGFMLDAEHVRQFVAAPLGVLQTVAEQLGAADPASLRLRVFEPVAGRFPETEPERVVLEGAPMAGLELGIAAGGRIKQRLYRDEYGPESWIGGAFVDLDIQLVNSEVFSDITGSPPPPSPVSAAEYSAYGLPWFSLYDEHKVPLAAEAWLDRLKSLGRLDPVVASDDGVSIDEEQIVRVKPPRSRPDPKNLPR